MPSWMSAEELMAAGYNIEPSYKPYISSEELQDTQETCQQFFIRNFFITQCALQVNKSNLEFPGNTRPNSGSSRGGLL